MRSFYQVVQKIFFDFLELRHSLNIRKIHKIVVIQINKYIKINDKLIYTHNRTVENYLFCLYSNRNVY